MQEIYEKNTRLRLAFVNGNHSPGHVKRIVAKLKSNELDGIVCVNMFGEGFNFPNLKIAVVHSPHKSLAITLQFIGRFARTGQENIGGATFLAEPTSSNEELGQLYEIGAVWRGYRPESWRQPHRSRSTHTRSVGQLWAVFLGIHGSLA